MIEIVIGITFGILIIIFFNVFNKIDKTTSYSIILSSIAFIYIGFTWSNLWAFTMSSIQASVFLILSYLGLKKNLNYLIIGYFLHGFWDIIYHFYFDSNLIPPHYDFFCLAIDFSIGLYLIFYKKQQHKIFTNKHTENN